LKSSDEGKKEERKYSIVLGGVGKTLAKRKGEFGEQKKGRSQLFDFDESQ